jgi:Flp pilus assembly protein TadG
MEIFMRKIKRGSFTVEAALLMPVIFLVLMGLLYLNFYVHNRAWLTAAAYEAAVSGSMEGYSKNGNSYEKADNQGRMLGSAGLPGGENLRMQISTGKSVQVTYRMEIPAGFLGLKWKIKATGKAVPLRPVGWIRKVKSSRDAVEEVR